MKKLLLITYYWPPAGGGGVQRWLKMSKYLQSYGWEPIIYTATPKEYVAFDESLVNEIPKGIQILKQPIWEPYRIYRFFTRQKSSDGNYSGFIQQRSKPTLAQKISLYLRSNAFIPDARKFWIKPSVRFLKDWLKNNQVDAIVSTGPPHSMHLIAMGLKKFYPDIPWISDFRDPWTNIDYYEKLNLTRASDLKHRRLEKEVLTKADRVVTVSWTWTNELNKIASRNDVATITNGFDPADFSDISVDLDSKFTLVHIGSMNEDRNPIILWSAIQKLLETVDTLSAHLSIELIGFVDQKIIDTFHEFDLRDFVEVKNFIDHQAIVKRIKSAQMLLLPINTSNNNRGIIPGKFYEYMAAKRPILGIGPPESDVAKIFNEYSIGSFHGYEDELGLSKSIESQYNRFLGIDAERDFIEPKNINTFSRSVLAKQYAALLDEISTSEP